MASKCDLHSPPGIGRYITSYIYNLSRWFNNYKKQTIKDIWRTITFNVILTITNAISKNLPSSGTRCLPWRTFTPLNRSGQNEQYLERTFHRCFLPNFSSFGREVSEEKIKMRKVNGRQVQPNELKLSSKHLWKVLSKECTFCYDPLPNMALHRQFLFLIGQFFLISSSETAWPN
jgi:hypothetical protein